MLCKPPFVVEVVKGDIVLSMSCVFPGGEDLESASPEAEKYGKLYGVSEFLEYLKKNYYRTINHGLSIKT